MTDASSTQPFHLDPAPSKRMRLIDLTVYIPPSSSRSRTVPQGPEHPARWRTLEFRIYALIVAVAVATMAWIPVTLSTPAHPNYPRFRHKLSPGWLLGRSVDNSDAQYRGFRDNFLPLTLAASVFLLAKLARRRLHGGPSSTVLRDDTYLLRFNFFAGLVMVVALHGTSTLKILPILGGNYLIARAFGASKSGAIITWMYNLVVLFMNDWCQGYKFETLASPLAFLDSFQGIYPRWHVSFNITMLRLLSFNMDYYWACQTPASPWESMAELNDKERQTKTHPVSMYSFTNYVSYALYPPLYLAGPIMTFNDYLWQHRKPLNITGPTVRGYAIRVAVSILTMEFILHFMYVVAIKDTKAWIGDTPAQMGMIGFWNLILVWLKLMNMWRFFRLWAMMDGIDAPENMIRCMVNNYSTLGFWRSWHRSYNLWLLRYIYIPMGGARNVILNMILVFTFVALWHDLTFKLLAWGWLASLIVVPEVIARYLLPEAKYGTAAWYRHVCAVGGVFNLLLLMVANLVGFVVGIDGTQFFLQRVFGTTEGWGFFAISAVCIFCAVQLMFEYREDEKRHGIIRRC
ncbi:glycerol transporter [Mycena amicta]|nr:glycerol transporter [Mycena amicta]